MKNLFLFFITVLIWGTTWIAIKMQLGAAAPEISILYRFLIASGLLLAYCKWQQLPLKFSLKEHFWMFLTGLGMFSIHLILVYRANLYLVSGLVAVLFSLTGFFNILNARFLLGKRQNVVVLVAILLGLIGLAIFFGKDLLQIHLNRDLFLGVVMGMCAAFIFSLGNIASFQNKAAGARLMPNTALSMAYGTLILLAYVLIQGFPFVFPSSLSYWLALLYLAVPGSVIAFLCYILVIQKMGPEKAGYITILFPVIAILISIFFEGYRLSTLHLIGLTLIFTGNVLVLFYKNIPAKELSR